MDLIVFCKRAGVPAFVAALGAVVGCVGYDGADAARAESMATAPGSAGDGNGSGSGSGSGSGGAGGGAGDGSCDPGGQGDDGGTVEGDDPCGSMTEPGAPPTRVVWVTEPAPLYELDGPIEMLWAFQYAVRVPPGEQAEYLLEHERCETPAHEETTCTTFTIPLPDEECAAAYAPRYGVDPSQYRRGTNVYSVTLRLRHGCAVESEDTVTWAIEYKPKP